MTPTPTCAGYPESLLASTDAVSSQWRADLIRSYLERDVPMFAPRIPAETLHRLWTMLAHTSGGLIHTLLDLTTLDDVLGHPVAGPSYESFAVESLIAALPRARPHRVATPASAHGLTTSTPVGTSPIAESAEVLV
ncbi:hypothetical protein [Nocardioides sp.]|uniref:hypothetical protein n=1 Tax=Nocardioides sp. TaxID=35761 RepID=UPI0039E29610